MDLWSVITQVLTRGGMCCSGQITISHTAAAANTAAEAAGPGHPQGAQPAAAVPALSGHQ